MPPGLLVLFVPINKSTSAQAESLITKVAGFYSGSYTYGTARIESLHGLFSVSDDVQTEQ